METRTKQFLLFLVPIFLLFFLTFKISYFRGPSVKSTAALEERNGVGGTNSVGNKIGIESKNGVKFMEEINRQLTSVKGQAKKNLHSTLIARHFTAKFDLSLQHSRDDTVRPTVRPTSPPLVELLPRHVFEYNLTKHPVVGEIRLLINAPHVCDNQPSWIHYVHTSPENFLRRMWMRDTWDSRLFFPNVSRVFLFGTVQNSTLQKKLEKESLVFGDIVQGDFHDAYRNLTFKAMMGLQWIDRYCPNTTHVLKSDDDVFIDLYHYDQKFTDSRRSIMCNKYTNMEILRNKANCARWCVDRDELPGRKVYPTYCSGPAFAFSSDLVPIFLQAAKRTPFMWVDDAFIGILAGQVPNLKWYDQHPERLMTNVRPLITEMEANSQRRTNAVYLDHRSIERDMKKLMELTLKRLNGTQKKMVRRRLWRRFKFYEEALQANT